ncbi:MAG: hypothetical protein ACI93N_001413 [Flavobacteriaceae bacterium]|jgi:hypothetical protein
MQQITNSLLMIRPVAYRMNEQTAVNNYFQENLGFSDFVINARAQKEFDAFVEKLRAVGVQVIVENDIKEMETPDSIFPNNWISFHENGDVGLYPMFAENRRRERREDILVSLEKEGFIIKDLIDYTTAEEEGLFLEGTGSLILDRVNQKAYCALSPRADEDLVIEFCEDFEFTPVIFNANQTVHGKRLPIYHTNVLMALGEDIAVICLDAIDSKSEKKMVIQNLKEDGKELVKISEDQMQQFAGNMLQVKGAHDQNYMVMSTAAFKSLNPEQITTIEKRGPIVHSDLSTIEACGGGSARCMMAEVFLPKDLKANHFKNR